MAAAGLGDHQNIKEEEELAFRDSGIARLREQFRGAAEASHDTGTRYCDQPSDAARRNSSTASRPLVEAIAPLAALLKNTSGASSAPPVGCW